MNFSWKNNLFRNTLKSFKFYESVFLDICLITLHIQFSCYSLFSFKPLLLLILATVLTSFINITIIVLSIQCYCFHSVANISICLLTLALTFLLWICASVLLFLLLAAVWLLVTKHKCISYNCQIVKKIWVYECCSTAEVNQMHWKWLFFFKCVIFSSFCNERA